MADRKRDIARAAPTELPASPEAPSKRAKVRTETQTSALAPSAAQPSFISTGTTPAAAKSLKHQLDAEEELLQALEADVAQQEEQNKVDHSATAPADEEDENYDESDDE